VKRGDGHIAHLTLLSPVSIQTQSLALRALRKRKPQETQAFALASSQSWLPLSRNKRKRQPIGMLGRSSGNHDWHAFLAVFVYATHATQAIAFEWRPGFSLCYCCKHLASLCTAIPSVLDCNRTIIRFINLLLING